MGLLDQVNYTGQNKPISVNEPYVSGNDPDVASESFDKYRVDVPEQTTNSLYEKIKSTQKMPFEGIASGNTAADALFNNNTTQFSRALSSRANKKMAQDRHQHAINNEIDNIQRQSLQQKQTLSNLNDIHKLKRQNFAGQLRFAAEVSSYQQKLDSAKLGVIGSIIGGAIGFVVGGPVGLAGGAAVGGQLGSSAA